MLDVPVVYSSNRDGFYEYNYLTGKKRVLLLDKFPIAKQKRIVDKLEVISLG